VLTADKTAASRAHGLTDAMGEKPRSLEGAAESAMQLVAADAFLAGRHQKDRLQPMAHGDVAGLENGPDFHGEGLAALVALVGADPGALAFHLGNALGLTALRANSAVRPKPCLDEGVGGCLVVEVFVGKNGFHGAIPLCRKHNSSAWVRQVEHSRKSFRLKRSKEGGAAARKTGLFRRPSP